jgi:serine/threonine protein kinase/Flp pilus assembly protein TadD
MRSQPGNRVEQSKGQFHSSWDQGFPALDASGSLATQQVEQMVAAWRRGEQILVEDVLAAHPELSDDAAIRLIYEEVCLRLEAGQTVDPSDIAQRFPGWRQELEILLDCQLKMHGRTNAPSFPEVGETLAGFRLIWDLGRGAAGRVFLAYQPSLADRPVVLKVTRRGREEHLSLARLQHMYIVPLYSEHVLQARDLQVLCMPFLGGATLAQVLEVMKDQHPHQRTGKGLIEALDKIQRRLPISARAEGPYRDFLSRTTYVSAICSIGACLADGLQYAHDRDLVHMDIKPSNILLADDGQPMLLDFHLARKPIRTGTPPPAWTGGTPEYMAPEQAQVVDCVRQGREIAVCVDERADVFSLGISLFEALGGSLPQEQGGAVPSLDRINSCVSIGLADIITKCLSKDPDDRYQDAASLALDLRCHLADLPLRQAPNRNLAETWRKWRRRRPQGLPLSALLVVLAGIVLGTAAWGWNTYGERIAESRASLAEGRAYMRRGQYSEAAVAFGHGLVLISRLPFAATERSELSRGLAAVYRREKAAELHRLAELIRIRYAIGQPAGEEARWLIDKGREVWDARRYLRLQDDDRTQPELDESITRDMFEILSFWADLRVSQAAPAERELVRQESARILSEAQTELGPLASIAGISPTDSQRDGQSLGAPGRSPSTPWECYQLGRSWLKSGNYQQAIQQFRRGLDLRPEDFWLNFYEGLCAYRTGKYQDALHSFHICIVLSPETAECYYNRGLANQELGHVSEALRDYDKALGLNPKLSGAALNRGLLLYRQGHLNEAASSLDQALASAASAGERCEIHYTMALVERAQGRRAKALEHLESASPCGDARVRALRERLRSGE